MPLGGVSRVAAELLKHYVRIKRLFRALETGDVEGLVKVIKEFEAWIEEELAESPRLL